MEKKDHMLSNTAYNRLKKLVQLGLPAFATFYASMSALWNWPNSEAVVGTCAALATFLGVLLTVSTSSWNNSEAKFDGELVVDGRDPDTGMPNLQLTVNKDPHALASKDYIRLKTSDVDSAA